MNTEFLKSKGASAISRALGVSRQSATKYVKGDVCLSVDQAVRLSKHYKVPLSAIIDPQYPDKLEYLEEENRRLTTIIETIKATLETNNTGIKIENKNL